MSGVKIDWGAKGFSGKGAAAAPAPGASSKGVKIDWGAKGFGKDKGKAVAVWQPQQWDKGKGWGKDKGYDWDYDWGKGKGKGKDKGYHDWDAGKGWDKGKGKGGKGKKGSGNGLREFRPEQKVWVGGVPTGHDRNALQEHMKQAGDCKIVSINKDGVGGAAYPTAEEAQNAVAMLNGSAFGGGILQVDSWTRKDGSPITN
eukprot:TRINITY_DN338_c2_g1_i1.p2 TRINITY_DN338_c2_g1~~TRINITY_DN338_c2_g1_i1.p2  ORF type:complete len:229 (-),score=76.27 TRINITY_DN338_c2_g1_i1:85-684(-)